jgi:hypothetical protein
VLQLPPAQPAELVAQLVEQSAQVAEQALETAEPVEAVEPVHDWLEATTPAPPTAMDDDDSPIFRTLRSNWLSAGTADQPWSANEVAAGWEVAEAVAEAAPVQVSDAGLPVRRPGHQLVPGGVRPAAPVAARDPEAIRARLSAHAAGVSRGRRTATVEAPDASEASPSSSTHPTQEGPA